MINLYYGTPMASRGHVGVADFNGFIWGSDIEWGGTIDYSPLFSINRAEAIKSAINYIKNEEDSGSASVSNNNLLWLYMLGRNML